VTLGGRAIELGAKAASPAGLAVDGQPIRVVAREVHFALHKPTGVVSTMSDPEGRRTVAELLPKWDGRLFPVGRLDYGSEGLMIVTSDGQLAQGLMHPKHSVDKEYAVKLREPLDERQLARLRRGVVEGGERLGLRSIEPLPSRSSHAWYSIVLGEGKNRHIRRMMAVVPAQVLRLKRVRIGPLVLGKLAAGEVRPLGAEEVEALREAVRRPEAGKARSGEARARRKAPGRTASEASGRPVKTSGRPAARASGRAGAEARERPGAEARKKPGTEARGRVEAETRERPAAEARKRPAVRTSARPEAKGAGGPGAKATGRSGGKASGLGSARAPRGRSDRSPRPGQGRRQGD
jgi:23S rRNA pseudouridine2605 synthase